MYKICVYVPENAVEKIKQTLFDAGAGRIGDYDSCCWQTDGTGQFRPLDGSNPTIGSIDKVEYIREIRIEMVCSDDLIKDAVQAIKDNHPYEIPAFDVLKIHNMLSY